VGRGPDSSGKERENDLVASLLDTPYGDKGGAYARGKRISWSVLRNSAFYPPVGYHNLAGVAGMDVNVKDALSTAPG